MIGILIQLKKVAKFYLFNSTFENLQKILLLFAADSNIILNENRISDIYSDLKNIAGLIYIINSSLSVTSSSIHNVTILAHMPLFFGQKSLLSIQNCSFQNMNTSCYPVNFWFISMKIKIINTKFVYYYKGLFYLNDCELALLNSSLINDNSPNKITSYEDIFSSFYILNSSFSVIAANFQKNKNEILKGAGVLLKKYFF